MVDRTRNEAAIVERVGELAKSYGIEVREIELAFGAILPDS